LKPADQRREQKAQNESQRHRDEDFAAEVQQGDRDPNGNDKE
jgi:hypothetical protein